MVKRLRRTIRRRSRRTIRRKRGLSRSRMSSNTRRIKPVRKFNKGRLMLEKSMMYARSLPQETSTRIFWQGNGTVDFSDSNTSDDRNGSNALDQIFNLSKLGGPLVVHYDQADAPYDMSRFLGKFSYQDQWANLYSEALVTGALLKLTIKRPVYPTKIVPLQKIGNAAIIPNENNEHSRVPGDVAQGYWYIRYRYTRSSDENPQPGDVVGHPLVDDDGKPLTDARLWKNMRDFLHDPTVTWVKDDNPKISSFEFTLKTTPVLAGFYGNTGQMELATDKTYNPNFVSSVMGGVQPEYIGEDIKYHQSFSNRPVKLIGAYSRRRHLADKNYLRNSAWQNLKELQATQLTPAAQNDSSNFFIKIGYICWNSRGTHSYSIPMDRIAQRNITATLMYKVRLRSPLVSPFDSAYVSPPPPLDDPNGPGARAINEFSQDELDYVDEGEEEDV